VTKNSASLLSNLRRWSFVSASLLAIAWAAVASQRGTSYQEAVTTTIFNSDASGAQLLMRSDDFTGPGEATYSTSGTAHSKTIISQIESNGEWQLLLGGQSTRTIWITPDNPINSSQPAAPLANYYWQSVEAYSTCRDQSGNIVPLENLVNGSNNCTLGVDFGFNGVTYKLMMNQSGVPVDQPAKCPASGCPATGLASVTCNEVSASKCINWTITPNMTAPNATVASLFSFTGTSKLPWVFVGQYFNTFRINIANP